MGVHPPQNGAIGYAQWSFEEFWDIRILRRVMTPSSFLLVVTDACKKGASLIGDQIRGLSPSPELAPLSVFFPTAESFGVSAQIGSVVVPGGPEIRFLQGSTRVPPGFHQGSTRVSTRVPPEFPPGFHQSFHQGSTRVPPRFHEGFARAVR